METVLIAAGASIIVGALALVGSIYGARSAAKQTETLVVYRIDQLEIKVDKHNHLVERMYCAEKKIDVLSERVDETNRHVETLEK